MIPLGQKAILTYLKDPFFEAQFGENPTVYYHFIMALSIQTGIVYAAVWHEDWPALENGYAQHVLLEGPAEIANSLLKQHFPASVSDNQGNAFYQKIYEVWTAQHAPYWKLSDPREYTFALMTASYQLGISLMLEKLGY